MPCTLPARTLIPSELRVHARTLVTFTLQARALIPCTLIALTLIPSTLHART
jgi:hypothetical protein